MTEKTSSPSHLQASTTWVPPSRNLSFLHETTVSAALQALKAPFILFCSLELIPGLEERMFIEIAQVKWITNSGDPLQWNHQECLLFLHVKMFADYLSEQSHTTNWEVKPREKWRLVKSDIHQVNGRTKTGSQTHGFLVVCVLCCRNLLKMVFVPNVWCCSMQGMPVSHP